MDDFRFDAASYLQRLHLSGDIEPTLEGLRTLQSAQLAHIPFENFDILLGRGIDLSPEPLFEKLVRRPRGGYCFELNGLFLIALRAFGFEARPLLARVHKTGTPSGRGHQLSLVEWEGRQWVADVGFGKDNPRTPLRLERDTVQEVDGQSFRLVGGREFGTMFQSLEDGRWQNLYSFDMEHVCPADIDYGNHFASTHPRSLFSSTRVAMKPTIGGFATLFGNRFKIISNGREQSRELTDGREYLEVLRTHFGIELDAPYEALRPIP